MIQCLKDLFYLGLYYDYLHFIAYGYFLATKPSPPPAAQPCCCSCLYLCLQQHLVWLDLTEHSIAHLYYQEVGSRIQEMALFYHSTKTCASTEAL